MADYVLTMADGDYGVTAVDNNTKVALDGAALKLALFSDEFGSALAAPWTESGEWREVNNEDGTVTEAGDELDVTTTVAPDVTSKSKSVVTAGVFDEFTVEMDVNDYTIDSDHNDYRADWGICVGDWAGQTEFASIFRRSRTAGPVSDIVFYVHDGGVETAYSVNTAVTSFKLKLNRTGNVFTGSYDIGAGWVDFTTITYPLTTALKLQLGGYARLGSISGDFEYCRITGSGYYWGDSPEASLVESGQTYAFDAGGGYKWVLTGASTVEDGDGGTVKYKVGYSDDGSTITWVDAAWKTAAEVNTNAGNGDYDDHRYLHVKAQYNSDTAQAPSLTSFTISGTKTLIVWTDEQSTDKFFKGAHSWKFVSPGAPISTHYYEQSMKVEPGEDIQYTKMMWCTVWGAGNMFIELYDVSNGASLDKETFAATTTDWIPLQISARAPVGCTEMKWRFGLELSTSTTCYFDKSRPIRGSAARVGE